jgi:RNA polymerase sigma-70 factor (ECF subfamily)
MLLNDRELIQKYKLGDENAFSDLVCAHMEPTYRFVYTLIRHEDAARDVVQETFVKVWKHLDTFNEDQKFSPWLLQSAKRSAFDWLRKYKKEISFSEFEQRAGVAITDVYTNTDDDVFTVYERVYALDGIEKIMRLAPALYREVFYYKQEGNTFAHIARITKTSLNTVKSRYRRAALFLKTHIESHQN